MPIAILPDYLANQIAAGEVVERPSSVVKELVENSLDAGATSIVVRLEESGLRRIEVQDDGHGIPLAELPLALARHATSKITSTEGLFNIHTFGFRGEALPSIASVARLTLTSRAYGSPEAWQITPEGELRPAALPHGTRIEVEDLFYATPARRKFLKSARSESMATRDVMEKLALANPSVSFSLWEDGLTGQRETLHFAPEQGNLWVTDGARFSPRVASLLGGDFAAESLTVTTQRNGGNQILAGVISTPQRHVGVAQQVYLFVNGRPIKDRSLVAAIRQGYGDILPKGRHPQGILMLSVAPEDVDVNVHPAKSEVRFRDAGSIFGFLFAAVREALAQQAPSEDLRIGGIQPHTFASPAFTQPVFTAQSLNLQTPPAILRKGEEPALQTSFQPTQNLSQSFSDTVADTDPHPLGAALGQVASSFIVATTAGGDLVLVDQHAAHERLVYEALKKQLTHGTIAAQPLLLPMPVPLTTRGVSLLSEHAEAFHAWGLELSAHSPTSIMVEALPALLGDINPAPLLKDLAAELEALGTRQTLADKMERILSTFACHHSVRANRRLSLAEQNQLLRDIEANPAAQTCNHGRPTVRLLKASELANLFER